jgi:hypothetical protein
MRNICFGMINDTRCQDFISQGRIYKELIKQTATLVVAQVCRYERHQNTWYLLVQHVRMNTALRVSQIIPDTRYKNHTALAESYIPWGNNAVGPFFWLSWCSNNTSCFNWNGVELGAAGNNLPQVLLLKYGMLSSVIVLAQDDSLLDFDTM